MISFSMLLVLGWVRMSYKDFAAGMFVQLLQFEAMAFLHCNQQVRVLKNADLTSLRLN